MGMIRTSEINMADIVSGQDVSDFLADTLWAIRSTHHIVQKSSPGVAIFGRDMLFDIPFVTNWHKIGGFRQKQTDHNTARENSRGYD